MKAGNVEDIYELSPLQQGILFHSLSGSDPELYIAQRSYRFLGQLDAGALERAWQAVIDRHSALRTSFHWDMTNKPLQVVHRRVQLALEQHDWRDVGPSQQQERLDAHLATRRRSGFNPAKAPLMHLSLIRLADDCYQFTWTHHMMQLDGWSVPVVIKEVFVAYEAFRRAADAPLASARPYGDYIEWLQRQDVRKAEQFWRQLLDGFSTPTILAVDRAPGRMLDEYDAHASQQISLPEALTATLQVLAQQHQLTINTLVQGAWSLLISRYSGTEDVVYGITSSGRPASLIGVEAMVGLFINTLPMRVQVAAQASLLPWLHDLQTRQATVRQYEYSSLVQIQGWSAIARGLPMFESIVVFENYPVDASVQQLGASLRIADTRSVEKTNYPLSLLITLQRELVLQLDYSCYRYDSATISRILGHLQTLFESIAADPNQRLADVQMLTQAEQRQILLDWNATQSAYPSELCLHQLVEAQVARTPEAIAVVFEATHLSYQELNRRSNQLAHALRALGVGPESRVGVCMERSLELVVGLLGVLKAGAAYLPLDPAYPRERLAFMQEDAQIAVLITASLDKETGRPGDKEIDTLLVSLPPCLDRLVDLHAHWPMIVRQPAISPAPAVQPGNLAYVIYTSGSTGRPKGAMNTHAGVCNRLLWMQAAYGLAADDRVLQKTPFSFDVSVWEFFWPLSTGAGLVMAQPESHKDSAYLIKTIAEQCITTLHFVPSMLYLFLEERGLAACNRLKRVICSGEALPRDLQEQFFAQLDAELHNLYGPTEAAIDVTFWNCNRSIERPTVPIGRPIANTQIYVLNARMQPVPIGVPGELFIGGVQLARGYQSRADLTAERFIPNPFAGDRDKETRRQGDKENSKLLVSLSPCLADRLYRTGDLVRYLASGDIEYLGRLDQQIKLRGFRIELGEIEAVLRHHPAVAEALVLAHAAPRDPSDKRLVAYVVQGSGVRDQGTGGRDQDRLIPDPRSLIPELRAFLQTRLPDYMLPSSFVLLAAMPLLPSGKVDRRALPEPEQADREPAEIFVAPRNAAEARLATLWSEALGIERIGIDHNFFDLGGDSFKAIRLARQFSEFRAIDLFKNPTIRELAAFIAAKAGKDTGLIHEITPSTVDKALSLVCIPYGGGNAIAYQPLARALPKEYALYAVALPGHDAGSAEALKSIEEIASACVAEIKQTIRGPLALYGHCIGVALTVEIARLLEQADIAIQAIFLGGSFPFPEKSFLGIKLSRIIPFERLESDQRTHAYLKSLGGFEDVVDPQELKFIMRNFRHDGTCALAYFTRVYELKQQKLKAPIIFVAGDKDPETKNYQRRFREWEFFSDSVRLAVVPGGGHYFIKHHAPELAQIIVETMDRVLEQPLSSRMAHQMAQSGS